MTVQFSNDKISDIYFGGAAIDKIYYGADLVYQKKIPIDPTPVRFNYTGGSQQYVVPGGVKKLLVDCVGAMGTASGSADTPGYGGRVQCLLSVTPGETLYLYVGRGNFSSKNARAFNGGGIGYAMINNKEYYCAGGGASDIRIGGTALSNRKVVAGGGGGACSNGTAVKGGNGGGMTGATGGSMSYVTGGKGGTQTGGGEAGVGSGTYNFNGSPGGLGTGGNGNYSDNMYNSAGGGGGYYGGGGGSLTVKTTAKTSGGGGGSSYTDSSLCSDVTHTQGYNSSGNGWIILTPQA